MFHEGFQCNSSRSTMEGFTNTPTSFYKSVYDYRPPGTECAESKGAYNNAYSDLNTKLDVLKTTSGCLSDTAKYAQEIELYLTDPTNPDSKSNLVQKYDKAKAIFTSYLESVDVLQTARGPFDTYMRDLEAKETELNAEYIKIQQGIRAGRRRFLDSDPQSGVTSVLGLQTADDKVLLAFWICFAAGIIVLEFFLLRQYGGILQLVSVQQKIAIFLAVLALCMGIAQLFIRMYA